MDKHFFFGCRTGVPRLAGGVQMTPESLVLLLRLGSFGYVWNWPVAVTVTRRADDQTGAVTSSVERHAIVDVTRLLTWGMGAVTLLMLLVALIGPRRLRARKRITL